MNEAQLVLQAYSVMEKKKRDQGEEFQKFLIVRESIIEALGIKVDAEPYKINLHDVEYQKSFSLPLIYLLAPFVGVDSITKMMDSYGNHIKNIQSGVQKDNKKHDDFESVFDLISEGYDADDIVREMTGKSIDELVDGSIQKQRDTELASVSSTKEDIDNLRKKIMEETPIKKKKKVNHFNIKLGE